MTDLIAVDWGTTNRRAHAIRDGVVIASERDGLGVTAVPAGGFEREVAGIRARFADAVPEDAPMLLAGMIGSTIGWRVAPYVPAPAGLETLVAGLVRVDARTAIVPGVSLIEGHRADVMRGEEVQLLGAVAAGLAPADALLVQPGTHCNWVELVAGRIARFTTAMTGELFALLRGHSILAPQLAGAVTPDAAFLAGVSDARDGDLAAHLFGIRAGKLLGARHDADAPSYASGLLIGADVAARLRADTPDEVHLLADPALGALYAAAVAAHGRRATLVDSHAAFVAGITRLAELIA